MRKGHRRHRRHPHHEARHGRRLLQRVSHALEDPGAGEEIFRLCPLADPHRCGDDREIRDRRGGRGRHSEDGRAHRQEGRGRQLDDPHLAAQQEGGLRRRLHRLLQGKVQGYRGPRVRHPRERRGLGQLPVHAVRPGEGALRLLYPRLCSRPAALLQRRDDHGKMPRSAAGVLPFRARHRRFAGSLAEHLPRNAPARPPAQAHLDESRKEDQGRAFPSYGVRPRKVRKVLQRVRHAAQIRHHRRLRHEARSADRPSALPQRGEGKAHLPARICGRHAGEPEIHLLRRRRDAGARREAPAERTGARQGLRYSLLLDRRGRVRRGDPRQLRREEVLQRLLAGSRSRVRRGEGRRRQGRRGIQAPHRFCQGNARRRRGEREDLPQAQKLRRVPLRRGRHHARNGALLPRHAGRRPERDARAARARAQS